MNKELIYEIVMPDFPRVVRLSESRRAYYYIKNKAVAGIHKLPAECLIEAGYNAQILYKDELITKKYKATKTLPERIKYFTIDHTKYEWKKHKKGKDKFEERLFNKTTGEYVIKNHLTAGTPNDEIINGQNFYNSKYDPFTAGKIMTAIHNYMIPFLKGLTPITEYPLIIDGFMYDYGDSDPISGKTGRTWDVGNRSFPYNKAFEDILQQTGVIKQDDFKHIIGPPRLIFRDLDNGAIPPVSSNYDYSKPGYIRTLVYQIFKVC